MAIKNKWVIDYDEDEEYMLDENMLSRIDEESTDTSLYGSYKQN